MKIFRIAQKHMMTSKNYRNYLVGIVLAPDNVTEDEATSAWSYAVRYSAKGFDLADYEAAAKLLQERHPSWQVVTGDISDIWYSASHAENDTPDP